MRKCSLSNRPFTGRVKDLVATTLHPDARPTHAGVDTRASDITPGDPRLRPPHPLTAKGHMPLTRPPQPSQTGRKDQFRRSRCPRRPSRGPSTCTCTCCRPRRHRRRYPSRSHPSQGCPRRIRWGIRGTSLPRRGTCAGSRSWDWGFHRRPLSRTPRIADSPRLRPFLDGCAMLAANATGRVHCFIDIDAWRQPARPLYWPAVACMSCFSVNFVISDSGDPVTRF